MATTQTTVTKVYAVLTGDLVNSTKWKPTERKKLVDSLNQLFDRYKSKSGNESKIKASFEIYRGDSFQAVLETPSQALIMALLIRSYLQGKVVFPGQLTSNDARIAIGKINYKAATLAESNGEAFVFLGRLLDNMKKMPNRIAFRSTRKALNDEMETSLVLLEAIISKWTVAQAEIIYYKLQKHTEATIADFLKIKQPAVKVGLFGCY